MTLNELIAKLQALAPDYGEYRAVVRGYEGGVDDIETIAPVVIQINANVGTSYTGDHEVRAVEDIRTDLDWDDGAPGYDGYAHAIFIKHGAL